MRKLTVIRDRKVACAFVNYSILVDGREYAVIKNGKTITVEIPDGAHCINVMNKLSIDEVQAVSGDRSLREEELRAAIPPTAEQRKRQSKVMTLLEENFGDGPRNVSNIIEINEQDKDVVLRVKVNNLMKSLIRNDTFLERATL
jgi:hypothetical protein